MNATLYNLEKFNFYSFLLLYNCALGISHSNARSLAVVVVVVVVVVVIGSDGGDSNGYVAQ